MVFLLKTNVSYFSIVIFLFVKPFCHLFFTKKIGSFFPFDERLKEIMYNNEDNETKKQKRRRMRDFCEEDTSRR